MKHLGLWLQELALHSLEVFDADSAADIALIFDIVRMHRVLIDDAVARLISIEWEGGEAMRHLGRYPITERAFTQYNVARSTSISGYLISASASVHVCLNFIWQASDWSNGIPEVRCFV
jgi:hypothetical protein